MMNFLNFIPEWITTIIGFLYFINFILVMFIKMGTHEYEGNNKNLLFDILLPSRVFFIKK